jgi:carbon monoxide dehydrogenase subunit G
MQTEKGRSVRADYRCVSAAEDQRYAWEQEIEGTPFERILQSSSVQIEFEPAGGSAGSRVSVRAQQRLRGLSRLGSPMMRTGTARNLDAAIDGIEAALT